MAAVPSIGRATLVEAPRIAPEAAATQGLYERHAAKIQSYCHHQLGSREEAEDAVQTTFMNAFRALGRGVVPEAESAWLFKIAENVCLSRRRSSWRRGRIESPSDFDVIEQVVPGPSVQRDELIGIEDALASMPEQQRRAILLREWQGLSYREIAAELEVSQSAVETLIFRARRSLAQGLEEPDSIKPAKRKSFRRAVRMIDLGSIAAAAKTLLAGSAAVKATAAAVAVTAAAGTAATVAPKVELLKPGKVPVAALVAPDSVKPSTSSTPKTFSLSLVSSTAGTADSAPKPAAIAAPRHARQNAAGAAVSNSVPPRAVPGAAAPAPESPLAPEPEVPASEPVQQPQPQPQPQPEPQPESVQQPVPAPSAGQPQQDQRRLESAPSAAERTDEGRKDEGKKDKDKKDKGKHTGQGAESVPAPTVAEPVASTPRERQGGGNSNARDKDEQGKHAPVTEAPAPAPVAAPAPVEDAKNQESKNDRQQRNDRREPTPAAPALPVPALVVAAAEPVAAPALPPAAETTSAPAPVPASSDNGSRGSGNSKRKGR